MKTFTKNSRYFFLIAVVLLFILQSAPAEEPGFKQYYLILSNNLRGQDKAVNSAVNMVNLYFNNKSASKEEVLTQLKASGKKLTDYGNDINLIKLPALFKNIQDVALRVSGNNLKVIAILTDMMNANYNFEYTADYLKSVKKLEEITKLLYHTKIAFISAQIDLFESNENAKMTEKEKEFFLYYREVLILQKDFAKIAFDISFYSLEYLAGNMEKYEIRIMLQEDLDKSKQFLLRYEAVNTEGPLFNLHKILVNGVLENYMVLKEFSNYLAEIKPCSMNEIQKHFAEVEEIFENYETEKAKYMENI